MYETRKIFLLQFKRPKKVLDPLATVCNIVCIHTNSRLSDQLKTLINQFSRVSSITIVLVTVINHHRSKSIVTVEQNRNLPTLVIHLLYV